LQLPDPLTGNAHALADRPQRQRGVTIKRQPLGQHGTIPLRRQAPDHGGDQVTRHDSRTRITGSQLGPAQVEAAATSPSALARPLRQQQSPGPAI
jgi:hypothetical protein